MPDEDRSPLHRRTIRKALIRDFGWHVVSRVDGYVDVRVPTLEQGGTDFLSRVRDAVIGLGYTPTPSHYRDPSGILWVRIATPETREQAGRGEHGS